MFNPIKYWDDKVWGNASWALMSAMTGMVISASFLPLAISVQMPIAIALPLWAIGATGFIAGMVATMASIAHAFDEF